MKNKSFKNYYDEIQVDENLLQQIPIKKHHYYKPILIISCVVLLFVLGIQNKETKDTFEILAYNQTYNSITTQADPRGKRPSSLSPSVIHPHSRYQGQRHPARTRKPSELLRN